ncbi:6-pyruvoyl tetrahydrobiopterin synthase [Polaribacter sejongensis]|jgi:6-pyruvoyltetrahydropterin/6-carboxytetrahydropterin synthase|uniref:6-carboxy-5,6,7,8-tetrahydropterin synthase n=1 Tax=Polaribacter sejongensis TaxID=985043 RepID=A0ABN5FEV2_9FLAO|nr:MULTISPECIES: 6-carboxytetrahydropterin synthase [Polaribacter]AUC22664.1 6-pyruvoyl tetrahydrobiopterin synthase [Polaribacter sejongensis]QXP64861.1 6-carboxytetrahydropterin synthase [Polaribacter sp. HaHaR_3_91]
MPKVKVYRRAHFNAAHRLFNSEWSDEKNAEVFGKCSNPNYHGHNYEMIVALFGEVDPITGFVYDLGLLRELIKEEIEEPFDHKNLNIEVPEFKNLNPTAENISIIIYNKLRAHIPANLEIEVTLYETRRNFVRYSGE